MTTMQRRFPWIVAACALLFAFDRLLAWGAVESNAAAAILSPGGAVPLGSLGIALSFLFVRVLLAAVFCATVAWAASIATDWTVGRWRSARGW